MEFSAANDFSELIEIMKNAGRRNGGSYSYDLLANKMGFKSPRTLAMVLKRQRAPSASLVRSVCDYLRVTAQEREFILWLAEKSRRQKSGKPLAALDAKIDRFRAIRSMSIDAQVEIAGARIEISPEAPEIVRRRLQEVARELAFEFGSSQNRSA